MSRKLNSSTSLRLIKTLSELKILPPKISGTRPSTTMALEMILLSHQW